MTSEMLFSFKKFPTNIFKLAVNEKIIKVISVNKNQIIWIVTKKGQMLLFNENELKTSWKTAWGVKAINLSENDEIADMFGLWKNDPFIIVYTEKGAKLVNIKDLKIQKRWQSWLKIAKLKDDEYIKWALSVREGKIKYSTASWLTKEIDLKEIKLKNRDTTIDNLFDTKIQKIWTD